MDSLKPTDDLTMPLAELPERSWLHAAALQLGIRAEYLADSWGGLKPFLLSSLNGHQAIGEPSGPNITGGTALGIKLLWALTGFSRQHPLGAAAFRFSGARMAANRVHQQLYKRVLETCKRNGPARHDLPLPEFDWQNRSPAAFQREFVDRPHPVVLRGFANASQAVREWTFANLLERFGQEEVLLTTDKLDGTPGRLHEVDSKKVYLHNSEILFRRHPELANALPLAELEKFSDMRPTYLQLFLGREGTGTPFHSAANWNFFVNVEGQKKWWFVDPRYGFLIYPFAIMGQAAAFAMVGYPDDYDADFFPAFAYCPVFEVVLNPGDVVFNPAWWWHAVRNLTPTTVGVASRWMVGGQAGTRLRAVEENYDIDRMRSWLYFAGFRGWPHLQGILRTPSPALTPTLTLREKRNRFTHLQKMFAREKVFGMRHRY